MIILIPVATDRAAGINDEQSVVAVGVKLDRDAELLEIAGAPYASRLAPGLIQHRQKQCGQKSDNGNYDKKFD